MVDRIVLLTERGADALSQRGEKGVGNIGQDQGHRVGPVGFQAPGVAVYLVAQPLGRLLYPAAVILAHGEVVKYLGHGAQSHTGLPGHVLHRGGVFFLFHGVHLAEREMFHR